MTNGQPHPRSGRRPAISSLSTNPRSSPTIRSPRPATSSLTAQSRRTAISSSYSIEHTPTSGCICSSTPTTDARAIPAALPSHARATLRARREGRAVGARPIHNRCTGVVDDLCFDSLQRLVAAASVLAVEQAGGALGHECPIPLGAEVLQWWLEGRLSSSDTGPGSTRGAPIHEIAWVPFVDSAAAARCVRCCAGRRPRTARCYRCVCRYRHAVGWKSRR